MHVELVNFDFLYSNPISYCTRLWTWPLQLAPNTACSTILATMALLLGPIQGQGPVHKCQSLNQDRCCIVTRLLTMAVRDGM